MEIIRAAKAGFCFGVKRALEMAEKTTGTSPTASLGPLIHNQQVVNRLEKQGLRVVENVKDAKRGDTLIIRSHGVPPAIYTEAKEEEMNVVDATCPFVQKAQQMAAKASEDSHVVIVGDKLHPEVIGILGWAGENAEAVVTVEEANALPFYEKLTVLAQTTQPSHTFHAIVEELKNHTNDLRIHNTICNATQERQKVANELADRVDMMIVVGGKNSANTRKLAAICSERTKTYLIETPDELQKEWFTGVERAGLTAGASTPDWIIEEVNEKMSEMGNYELENNEIMDMETWEASLQEVRRGAIVKGTIVKIDHDEVWVDLGWKSEGVIPIKELSVAQASQIADMIHIGDEIEAVVIKDENKEGHPVLSKRRVDERKALEHLEKIAETKEVLEAKVADVVKGGLIVDLGMRGFVPASQIQLGYVEDLGQFVGQTLRLRVIEFDPSKRRLVLSQKVVLQEEREANRTKILETLNEGDVVTGTVGRLANFGAFVDLGGVDGLLHVSEMAYTHVKDPAEIVKVGDEVEVQVIKLDSDHGRISLSLKSLKPSPWETASEKYAVGTLVTGKVVRVAPFGAFVQLEDGVDGLVHISQLSHKHIAKVEEAVKVGDMVQAKVIECKPEEKRISLSIREAIDEAQAEQNADLLAHQPEDAPVTIGDAVNKES